MHHSYCNQSFYHWNAEPSSLHWRWPEWPAVSRSQLPLLLSACAACSSLAAWAAGTALTAWAGPGAATLGTVLQVTWTLVVRVIYFCHKAMGVVITALKVVLLPISIVLKLALVLPAPGCYRRLPMNGPARPSRTGRRGRPGRPRRPPAKPPALFDMGFAGAPGHRRATC